MLSYNAALFFICIHNNSKSHPYHSSVGKLWILNKSKPIKYDALCKWLTLTQLFPLVKLWVYACVYCVHWYSVSYYQIKSSYPCPCPTAFSSSGCIAIFTRTILSIYFHHVVRWAGENLTCISSPWMCVKQNLSCNSLQVLCYTWARANDTYEVFPCPTTISRCCSRTDFEVMVAQIWTYCC